MPKPTRKDPARIVALLAVALAACVGFRRERLAAGSADASDEGGARDGGAVLDPAAEADAPFGPDAADAGEDGTLAVPGDADAEADADADAAPDGTPDADDGSADADGGVRPPFDVGACGLRLVDDGVTVNEVQGSRTDWIELHNGGGDTADLTGWVVADFADDGCPRLAEALTFPAGAVVDGGAKLVVLAGQTGSDPGPFSTCPTGAPPLCYYARFGLSATRGNDGVYLLRPGGLEVAARVPLPGNVVSEARTWGRLPDGTGAFTTTTPTPGAPNAP